MTYTVRRQCGHPETVEFRGTAAAWKEREALMKKLPCNKCHTERLREKVSKGAPTLPELCLGGENHG